MAEKEYQGVYIMAEQVDGTLASVGLELLGKGKELARALGTQVTAVLLGYEVEPLCKRLARYGADRVVLVDDPALKTYKTEPYTRALATVIETYKPEILLCGATAIGRDLAPRASARVRTGLTADCTGLDIQEETGYLLMTRPAFGGNIMATILCTEHRPQMATVRPGVMRRVQPQENANCPVEKLAVARLDEGKQTEILDIIKKMEERIDIRDAKVLVSGGRGMGKAENFALLEELAQALGGTIASSRACVDAGWVEKGRQVGQTGKTVRPDLYIACGISGAVQHLAGMEESGIILAINKDASAPIFEVADYGVVGDVLTILPQLTRSVQRLLSEKREPSGMGQI